VISTSILARVLAPVVEIEDERDEVGQLQNATFASRAACYYRYQGREMWALGFQQQLKTKLKPVKRRKAQYRAN
jgi:hypothetical protein